MEKYNHNDSDFMRALNLDKDELMDMAKIGFEMHMIEGKPISKCILAMVDAMKKDMANELKMFAAGMVFAQVLSVLKDKDHSKLLKRSIVRKDMPFNAEDLMKSIRDELDGPK